MGVFKRPGGRIYRYEFVLDGKRIQESAKTTSKTVAQEAERRRRRELEQARAGIPVETRQARIRSVGDAVQEYLDTYELNHRDKSVQFAKGCLAHVKQLLGTTLLSDLSEPAVRQYIKTRVSEGASGRTVNAELGELSRAVGKPWSALWPRVRKMEERRDVGRALSSEEEERLMEALQLSESQLLPTFIRMALLTAMRVGEILSLKWEQVSLSTRVVTVGRAKTPSGTGRQVPMNGDLFELLASHAAWFTEKFGETRPEWYVFPSGNPPSDPRYATTSIKTGWNTLRRNSGVRCRLHDLRHTAITKLAEARVSETTMLALAGHMSRAMLERYSHIRMDAKRAAVEAMSQSLRRVPAKPPALELSPKTNWRSSIAKALKIMELAEGFEPPTL